MKRLISGMALGIVTLTAQAQVGIGTATPHSSAQLEISSPNKGLLIPRMNMAGRPASPATGLLIYQTDATPGYYYYDGTSWIRLATPSSAWSTGGNDLTGTEFIGANNNRPLVLKVNGLRTGYFDADGTALAMGARALEGNTGSFCIGIGYRALLNNSVTFNTAIGHESMSSGNTGSFNTALGSSSLFSNTTGSNNVALGRSALYTNLSGSNNVAIGNYSLGQNISGSLNVAVGQGAFTTLKSGDYNVAIGYSSGSTINGMTNTISIGYNANALANNSAYIGNASMFLIGGAVGWSTLSDIRFKTDVKPAEHGLDFILKLQPITYHIDVKKLNSFLYGNKSDSLFGDPLLREGMNKKATILYSGFSAQQVEDAAAGIGYDFSAVHKPDNKEDHYALDYSAFVVPLVKAVQEQQQIIEELKKESKKLREEIELLRQKK